MKNFKKVQVSIELLILDFNKLYSIGNSASPPLASEPPTAAIVHFLNNDKCDMSLHL